jgi:hypothetical protein
MWLNLLTIGGVIASLGLWFLTYICLRGKGCNAFLVSGYTTLNKADRAVYKAKYDVVAMNRFFAKRGFLPLAVAMTLYVPGPFLSVGWYAAVSVIAALAAFVSAAVAAVTILGNKFIIK